MRCSDVDSRLASYVDDETPPDERVEIDEHLHACRPCRDRADAERTARDLVRANRELLRGAAPEALHSRCSRLCAHPARRSHRRWVPVSLAAAAALVGLVWFGRADAGTRIFAAELTLDHMKCAKLGARVTGTPSDLARYWRESVGWPVVVPAAGAVPGLRLTGIRRCASSEGRTAHIMYTQNGEPLSLFIAQDDGRTARTIETLGHEAVVWSIGDRTYVLIGQAPPDQMQVIAAAFRKEIDTP
jgi:anti-sigma factor RsiW